MDRVSIQDGLLSPPVNVRELRAAYAEAAGHQRTLEAEEADSKKGDNGGGDEEEMKSTKMEDEKEPMEVIYAP